MVTTLAGDNTALEEFEQTLLNTVMADRIDEMKRLGSTFDSVLLLIKARLLGGGGAELQSFRQPAQVSICSMTMRIAEISSKQL